MMGITMDVLRCRRSEIVEQVSALRQKHVATYEVRIVGMLEITPQTVGVYYELVPLSQPLVVNVSNPKWEFELPDDVRESIMEHVQQYARDHADSVRETDRQGKDVDGPHIDDALLDAIQSDIAGRTKIWIGKR